MRFARFGSPGSERPALIADDAAWDLTPVTADLDGAFFASDGIDRAAAAYTEGVLERLDTTGLRRGAPIARPSAIVCIGMNYAAHAAESGMTPPSEPVLFLKTPNTVCGPDDDVPLPPGSTATDWEVELGVVIGKRASYLSAGADVSRYIAGFVAANDLSERAHQIEVSGGQWSKGKCSPGFCPVGPELVTPSDLDHRNLGLRSWVNGEPRQNSSTADMIFSVERLIVEVSQYLALEPGDLLLTGTPEGVALSGRFPYLAADDVVEIEVDGLGRQRQRIVPARHPQLTPGR